MNLLQNNPYRTVGLLVGATAREQERQVRRLKQFVEAEQDPQDDFSFPRLGRFRRTLETLHEASSKLNLDSDKMSAALFWFYNGNQITDEPAFDAIKQGSLDQAINIWSKLTAAAEVTQRNASAHSNLSTLYLSRFSEDANDKEALLEKGISLKLKFLDSDFTKDIKTLATDETFKITKKDLQILFLNQVLHEIEKHRGITAHKFLDIIARQEFSAKEDFLKGFAQKPIEEIEKKVKEAKIKRKADKANALNTGKALYNQTIENLKQLKNILGASSLKFSNVSDKVSDEILQCGIGYFNGSSDQVKASEALQEIFEIVNKIVISGIIKQRCQENADAVARIAKAIMKAKYNDCFQVVDFLRKIVSRYRNEGIQYGYVSSSKVRDLLEQTLTDGIIAKIAKSNNDELILSYLEASEFLFDKQGKSSFVHSRANLLFENLPGNSKYKDRARDYAEKSRPAAGGCYIATMVYGDYNHPQVKILRQFRDDALSKSVFGKQLIAIYCRYSPQLVEKLKNKKIVNGVIRKILNQIIKLIN